MSRQHNGTVPQRLHDNSDMQNAIFLQTNNAYSSICMRLQYQCSINAVLDANRQLEPLIDTLIGWSSFVPL